MRRNHDFAIMSKKGLDPVGEKKTIDETRDYKFVDMYPIFPTIDLKEEHIYDKDTLHSIGFRSTDVFKEALYYPNTIFHINDDEMPNETDVSRLIMFAFGTAYAHSQILKQNKVGTFLFKS